MLAIPVLLALGEPMDEAESAVSRAGSLVETMPQIENAFLVRFASEYQIGGMKRSETDRFIPQPKPGNVKGEFRVYRFSSSFAQHFFDLV
jgi:hypothetical protein